MNSPVPPFQRLLAGYDVDPTTGCWDELQRLKRECGRGERDAVEIFPADTDLVNVANMRHLWIVDETSIPFKWRKKTSGIAP